MKLARYLIDRPSSDLKHEKPHCKRLQMKEIIFENFAFDGVVCFLEPTFLWNGLSSKQFFQFHFPFFPVWHFFGLKIEEFLGMIVMD